MDALIEDVIKNIEYTALKDVLIKPLNPIQVEKEITEPVPTGEKDENGYEKYETKTEVKTVDSDWATGVVLQLPAELLDLIEHGDKKPFIGYSVGDTVVYNKKMAKDFDLYRNSQLVKTYDIVAKYNR